MASRRQRVALGRVYNGGRYVNLLCTCFYLPLVGDLSQLLHYPHPRNTYCDMDNSHNAILKNRRDDGNTTD